MSSRSNRSSGRSSRSSGRSSSSSVKLKEAKAKAAVAKLKLKQLDELHQLKKQQQELKMSEEKIKMENEPEIAEIETKVWEEQDSNSQIKQSEPQKYVTEPIVDKNKESSHHDPKPKVNPAAPEETNSKHITESQPVAVGEATNSKYITETQPVAVGEATNSKPTTVKPVAVGDTKEKIESEKTFQLNPNTSVWQGITHLPVDQQNVVCESNDNLENTVKATTDSINRAAKYVPHCSCQPWPKYPHA